MLYRIVSALGWVGAVLVFASAAGRFFRPDWQNVWFWMAASGLTCVVLYMVTQWRDVARVFSHRQARYGSLALASMVLALGVLIAVNYIASRQNRRWDLTAARQFTLADQTVRILENLDAPVRIRVFARDDDFDRFRARLVEYEDISDHVSVDYFDVDKQPLQARQYEVQSYGTVVFEYEGRLERVVADTEQELTNALIKAIEGEERTIYFVQGHGEKDVRSAERDGYNGVSDALTRDNFRVETLVLAQQTDIPADASVVVVAGPQTDLFPGEIDSLRAYLDSGGKALFLIDPPEATDAAPYPNLSELFAEWAITLGNDVVVDVSGIGQLIGTDASVPVVAEYPPHAITNRFSYLTAFPLARSVSPVSGGIGDRVAQPFVDTSAQSWAESDITRLIEGGEVELDEDQSDRPGPITIGVAVAAIVPDSSESEMDPRDESGPLAEEGDPTSDVQTDVEPFPADTPDEAETDESPPETRLAVLGDSDFAANFGLGIQGNRDLFLNIVDWLAQQENLVAIRPRVPEDRRITLTLDQQQRINMLAIFLIPGVVLGTGVYTWWLRRE